MVKEWATHIVKNGNSGNWDIEIREQPNGAMRFGRCIARPNKHLKDRDVVTRTITVAPRAVELLRKVTEDNTNPLLAAQAQRILEFVDTDFDHPRGQEIVRFSISGKA